MKSKSLIFFCILVVLGIISCMSRSPLSTYYLLPMPDEAESPSAQIHGTILTGPVVAIEGVMIPGYLEQPHIVIRQKETALVQFAEFHRWSESLSDGCIRVLQKVISKKLSIVNGTAVDPRSTMPHQWVITVSILQLDGMPNGETTLEATWTLSPTKKASHTSGHFKRKLPTGPTITDMVTTQGKLLEELGIVIADEICELIPYRVVKE